MKKYTDYSRTGNIDLTDDEFKNVVFTKFKIIVPSQEDKDELMEAFKHFHDSHFDSNNIVSNQLAHLYHETDIIEVNEKLYNSL